MFASAVLAVSVLRKKCSKKQKSINTKSDFLVGKQDSVTSEILFKPEKDTLEHLHNMEQFNKSLVKRKSVDQSGKLDAFENNFHHVDARIDSNASESKEPSLKSNFSYNIDQNYKVDNEVGQVTNLVNNKAKIINSETGDVDDSFNLTYPSINNFNHMVKTSDTSSSENKDKMIQSKDTINSLVDSQPLMSSHLDIDFSMNTQPLIPFSSSPLDELSYRELDDHSSIQNTTSDSNRKSVVISDEKVKNNSKASTSPSSINTTFNNNALQITSTKILNSIENEPNKKETKEIKPRILSRSVPVTSSPVEFHSHADDIFVDPCIAQGTTLYKVSAKKKQRRTFKIDVDQGRILWDSKKSGKVNIENIKELRIGEAIRNIRIHAKIGKEYEDRWFTIIYVEAGKYKSLHLLAETADLFNKWVDNLQRLYLHRKDMIGGLGHLRKRHSIWLKQHWKQANKDGDSKLIFDEVSRLCRQLNINMSKQSLKANFHEADKRNNGWLDFDGFQRFVKIIKKRPELDELFESLTKTKKDILTLREFKDFLSTEQKCMKEGDYDNLYYKFCDKDNEMNSEGFNSFLMSSDNSVFSPDHAKLYQDMTQPLCHYFIDSSHNTYLLGHQLTGESSIEGYIRVLQRGCRCVEIDCWDGPDGPVVTHGHTWTSKILFQDVISAIRTYAFKASPYPLILSLEVHCSIEQQEQMAKILSEILGFHLVTEFFSDDESELPSPECLLYKILLKGKNLPHGTTEDFFDSTDTESATDTESDAELSKDNADKKNKKGKSKVAKALSDLVVYCSAVKFKGFDNNDKGSKFYHMSSFSERVATRLSKTDKQSFIQHNSRHLSRIYPSGYRIASSNYEPHHQWMVGSQLVALNWQTFDLGMQINQAMFSVNGRCGYVLKPKSMRGFEHEENKVATDSSTQYKLEIEIISAQQLSGPKDLFKEIIDPFVEVELLVPGADVIKKKTKTILDNGFNPLWKETLTFTIDFENLELVFLRFTAWDEDVRLNEFIGYYCIPVASLQEGYRHIPLYDINGEQYLFTTLFVRLSLKPLELET